MSFSLFFFFIVFLIGLFSSKKEINLNFTKKNQKSQEIITNTSSNLTTIKDSFLILEFEKRINENLNQLTKKINPDKNKDLYEYQNEVSKILKQFDIYKEGSNSTKIEKIPDLLIKIAQDLSKINPPPLFYETHLELIKTYYSLGVALKEFLTTTDINKKILLYNLIKSTLEKLKFQNE